MTFVAIECWSVHMCVGVCVCVLIRKEEHWVLLLSLEVSQGWGEPRAGTAVVG